MKLSTDPNKDQWLRDTVVGQIVVWISFPFLVLDLLRVIEPFSIDFLLNELGLKSGWSLVLTVLAYPLAVATVLELKWPRRGRNTDQSDS
ncbi:hypothetical protein [Aliiroseovarius sp. F20344]|uniref:hypothetical protein n=1 Tax=Aliiroseovarius sp. F20344 TaxID=2926414 RepID=UPI001FF6B346|nr:hypothetical protein [Aliiroseovarius sp. F20344]MCK0142889.1 hypothetical protein [Aliiroseovarius sp. F20344]